ncbi:MAG: hypothetical protein DRQ39_11280, partial [Gammaproteobacteria bacterium]
TYDSNDDTDIPYIAATGTTDTLNIFSETELHIASSTTFSPSGDVTISGNASSSSADGSLHIDNNAVFVGYSTSTITLAGSLTVDDGATFTSASTTVLMNATTTGKTITTPASQEIIFNELIFNGVSGGWNINGDIRVVENINVSTGTVTGTSDVVIENGSMSGNGTVSFGSGTTTIENTNTLGGNTPWTFGNLVLGNGVVTGTTTPGGATTTILDTLTINTGHFLDAGNTVWVLSGTGDVFMEDGTFLYDTSTIIYNGTGAANILSTNYYNLILNALGGSPTYTATGLGVQVFGDLDIGNTGTTTVDFDTNDSALNIEGGVAIHTLGTFVASDSGATTLAGSYDNNGIFTSSGGVLTFDGSGVHTIAAGNSAFGSVIINGSGDFTVSEHATATSFTITAADDFTLASSQALAVGGTFTNSLGGADTIWTDSILHLYGGGNYEINASTIDDSYGTLVVGTDTDIRMWNSDASTTTVNSSGSIYSQDHDDVSGDLYIYGDYVKSSGSDYWSYAKDFDGTDISGSPRKVDVYIAANASTTHLGGSLAVIGTAVNSTAIQNQGVGTYAIEVGGNASTTWQYYDIRDSNDKGLVLSGTPDIGDLSYGQFLVANDNETGMTVDGSVITNNPASIYTGNVFATSSGVTTAYNVTIIGTTLSAWRFTGHSGDIDGEVFDNDDGDPGYITWDDSALAITISGKVYSDEGSTVSGVCTGASNIKLVGIGFSATTTSCNGSGTYIFNGISYAAGCLLNVYIDGETENGVTVTHDPISSINNLDIYENRVIVRHESSDPLTIDDMTGWDSSDDVGDVIFTALSDTPDTLTLPSNVKLLVWTGKQFEPDGDVTVTGSGAGAAYDGTLELYDGATFTANSGEEHSVGGSLITG